MGDYGPSAKTGRENKTVYFCPKCDWEKDVTGGACAIECPKCQHTPLRWVRWEALCEDQVARAHINFTRQGLFYDRYDRRPPGLR